MSAALTLLLIGSLLQGALCGEFKASMPQTIKVLRGSCVTIPCSFDVEDQYESHLDNTYVPPRPTLTPSALKVKEGTSVSLTCSAPAPCLSPPPALTWTKGLGESVETLQEDQDKTKVQTSAVTFTASQRHHGKTISCTATYNKQDGSTESAVSWPSLTAHISYSPKDTTMSVRPSGPVPEGSNVTLTCSSTANPAVKNYTWYRADGDQETLMGTGAVLNIKASKDDSPFYCKAENIIGDGRSTNKQIDVQCKDHI
ncbi:vascular cell adhesion protein 1-like [Lycodopsis pacificus]